MVDLTCRAKSRLLCSIALVLIVAGGCRTAPEPEPEEVRGPTVAPEVGEPEATGEPPKRIILFIGDGMGLTSVAAAAYASGSPLAMMEMAEFGLNTTHSHEFVTTDSAASATALATGEKTHFEGVGLAPTGNREDEEDEGMHLRTVVRAAQERDYRTGLVAPVRITHATPGAFAAHRYNRNQYEDIALDMAGYGLDLMLGAGSQYFEDRQDGRDLMAEMEAEGVRIARSADEVREAAGEASRLVGLMHERDMRFAATGEREMELKEMVEVALEVMDEGDPEGFFLMVEGAYIDWAGHALDGAGVVSETLDMDRALQVALEYARGREDTVVIVTADHETGGMDLIEEAAAREYLEVLGGEMAAFETTVPEGLTEEERELFEAPFDFVEIGEGEFGPAGGGQFVTSFGWFSPASRVYADGGRRFSAMHTPLVVPVFAEGRGAREAAAVRDNADLGRLMVEWIDGEAGVSDQEVEAKEPSKVIMIVTDGLGIGALTAGIYHFGDLAIWGMPTVGALWTHGEEGLIASREGAWSRLVPSAVLGGDSERSPTVVTLEGSVALDGGLGEALERSGDEERLLVVMRAGDLGALAAEFDDGERYLAELVRVDRAVREAVEFAREDGDTLVVVTTSGDDAVTVMDNHYGFYSNRCGAAVECGGEFEVPWRSVALGSVHRGDGLNDEGLQGEFTPPRIALQYTWLAQAARQAGGEVRSARAANFVPLFAYGPGAERWSRVTGQAEVGGWLREWSEGGEEER